MYWLNGAFVGSTDATARWLDGKWWPVYKIIFLKVMASHRESRNVANVVEQQFEAYAAMSQADTTRPPYRFPDIDLQTLTSPPTRRALQRITAADLLHAGSHQL